jgi:hypothetical protein
MISIVWIRMAYDKAYLEFLSSYGTLEVHEWKIKETVPYQNLENKLTAE